MRGIFGMPKAGMDAGAMGMQQPAPRPAPEEKPARWMDGGKFNVKDGLGVALGLLGTAFGSRPILAEMLMGNMMQKKRGEQEAQRAQADRMARREDLQWEWANKPKEGPKPGTFEWYQTASPEQRALYDQYDPVTVGTWQGPIPVPRRPPVGSTVSMDQIGPAPAATIQNTPAPQSGLTDQQASAIMMQAAKTGMLSASDAAALGSVLGANGNSAFNQWVRENNIRIGN